MRLDVYCDGACWGNPGPAAIGGVIKDEHGRQMATISRYIGKGTNNQAEYRAVICALKLAAEMRPAEVTLHVDSELVARQLEGKYRVKSSSLFPLYAEAVQLTKKFASLSIQYIGHIQNHEAHALAQKALKTCAGSRP